jgi:hypothetical protein
MVHTYALPHPLRFSPHLGPPRPANDTAAMKNCNLLHKIGLIKTDKASVGGKRTRGQPSYKGQSHGRGAEGGQRHLDSMGWRLNVKPTVHPQRGLFEFFRRLSNP